ncbi:MAG: S8 family serine peptidase [Candidatus Cloacimonetes bacterium]|nr:S8 family serine peptidase [Candidatus Cloacimonadota bacterium]
MKKELFMSLLILLIGISLAAQPANARYSPNHILVKLSSDALSRSSLPQALGELKSSFGVNELDQILQNRGGTSISPAHRQVKDTAWAQSVGWNRWYIVHLDGRSSVEAALASFQENRYVEAAQPDYLLSLSAVTNDPLNGPNWGHNNTGSNGPGTGTAGFDAKAHDAWDMPQGYGSTNIIIAIIDTGVDIAHQDLRLMAGYDYGDNDSNPMDDSAKKGHGTACAGIAAAKANNGIGVAGIAGGCTVMPLKVANSAGDMYTTALNNALTYAADNGAHIISLSLGIEDADVGQIPTTDNALNYAYNHGCLLFAATGNENASSLNYPANHQNVIAVGAASPSGQRKSPSSSDNQNWWGSNYGVNTINNRRAVDIMGPTILPTTDISGSAGYSLGNYSTGFNGTSCATPYVAGAAALLLSANPNLSQTQLRNILTSTATDMTADGGTGWDRYTGYGMINAYAAVLTQYNIIPQVQISSPVNNSKYGIGDSVPINTTASVQIGTISKMEFFVDNSLKATLTSEPYSWQWDSSGYSLGSHQIKAVATSSIEQSAEASITLQLIAPADEGFESGDFNKYAWVNDSASPWTVQSEDKYAGNYAAKSGAIGNSQSSELKLSRTVTAAGEISFYFKTSSELNYDMLRFYIDGEEKGNWSGLRYDWNYVSFPVSVGDHSFSFKYTKDVSSSSGLDCAWIDHISLPPSTLYLAPPQNLSGVSADNEITLYWDAPNSQLISYQIYKDDALLATTTNTVYTDYDVVNYQSYSYYVKAVYPEGVSSASNAIDITAGTFYDVYLGTGDRATLSTIACPINIYKRSLHGQAIYTKDELNAQGITGPILLQSIGLDVASAPIYSLPNFVIRIKHTAAVNVANWQSADGLQTVYGPITYNPQPGIDMLRLSTPFLWNGVDNILIDTAFSLLSNGSTSGTVFYTTIPDSYRCFRDDLVNTINAFSDGELSGNRPNLQMRFRAIPPELSLNQVEIDFESVIIGTLATRQLVLSNIGGGTLNIPNTNITISGDAAFSLEEPEANLAIDGGQEETLVIKFQPQSVGDYSATLSISLDENRSSYQVPLSGKGVGVPYDYPNGSPVTVGSGEDAIIITVDNGNANNALGGEIPPFDNPSFMPAHQFVLSFYGGGPYNVNIATSAPWGAYYQGGWQTMENSGGEISFQIDAAKGGMEIPFILGDSDPTLPVTLSSFTAAIYSQNMVKIAWIAESETDHAGYNLYRSEVSELNTALILNNGLITEGSQNGSQRQYQYMDREVYAGNSYYYWLESLSLNGTSCYYGPVSVKVLSGDIEQEIPEIPMETQLFSAFPNPFNPNTTLRYSLSEPGEVKLMIYNLKGQLIQSYQRQHDSAGYYQVHWDGRDQSGKPVAAGIYFYRMQSGDYHSTKKMILSK